MSGGMSRNVPVDATYQITAGDPKNKAEPQKTLSTSHEAAGSSKGTKRTGELIASNNGSKARCLQFPRLEISHERIIEGEDTPDVPKNGTSNSVDLQTYLKEFKTLTCIDITKFNYNMFNTRFGKLVLLVKSWAPKIANINASFQACGLQLQTTYDNARFKITSNGRLLAEGQGNNKQEAKANAEALAWHHLTTQVVIVLVKQQWIAQGSAPISVSDVTQNGRQTVEETFGTPVESSVAAKIMRMMGWNGGGLGAGSQGIVEPIAPKFQMVSRLGLGSSSSDIRQMKRGAHKLMQRLLASRSKDIDLVFSSNFSKEERALLHKCAQNLGLQSRSYSHGEERFLVVKKKINPFEIVKEVIEEGGTSARYQVFLPVALSNL